MTQSKKLRRPDSVFKFKYFVNTEEAISFLSSKGIVSSSKISNKYLRLSSHLSSSIYLLLTKINCFSSKCNKFWGSASRKYLLIEFRGMRENTRLKSERKPAVNFYSAKNESRLWAKIILPDTDIISPPRGSISLDSGESFKNFG